MSGRIDLHTHSTASDGLLAPAALVAAAAERGVAVLALTDHDTVAGVAEAARSGTRLGVRVVPGLELSCDPGGDVGAGNADILGYFVDVDDPDFLALTRRLRSAREERARAMVEQLRRLGHELTWDAVLLEAGDGCVGRPHVAQALVAIGAVPDVAQAFSSLLRRGGPGYVDRRRMTPAEACRHIRGAGGVPVLAHPVPIDRPYSDPKRLRTFLPPLIGAGLGGLECHYAAYTERVTRWLVVLADHFGLVPTGGSDYHGPGRSGRELGAAHVPADTVERLEKVAAVR